MLKTISLLLLGAIVVSSCGTSHLLENNLKNANESGQMRKTGQELAAGVDAKNVSQQLVNGLSEALSDSSFKKSLQDLISSLITQSGSTTAAQIDSIKLVLIGMLDEVTAQILKSESSLVGDTLLRNIHLIKMELLGNETNTLIAHLIDNARSELLSDSTRIKLGAIRDELLGDRTNMLVRAIVDSAVSVAVRRSADLQPQLSFIQKYARNILIVAGVVVAALLAFGYWLRRRNLKYGKIINVITQQIEESPDQVSVKDLKQRIKKTAEEKKVETQLNADFISKRNEETRRRTA